MRINASTQQRPAPTYPSGRRRSRRVRGRGDGRAGHPGIWTRGGNSTNLRMNAGSMTTGQTSTETPAVPAAGAVGSVATSLASPTVKATPEWGQPAEP